jgi:hypothetical protein
MFPDRRYRFARSRKPIDNEGDAFVAAVGEGDRGLMTGRGQPDDYRPWMLVDWIRLRTLLHCGEAPF